MTHKFLFLVGVVGVGDPGALVEDGHNGRALKPGIKVLIRVLGLAGQHYFVPGRPGQVGVRRSAMAAVGSLLERELLSSG